MVETLEINDTDPEKSVVLASDMQAAIYMSWLYLRVGQEALLPPPLSGLNQAKRKTMRQIVATEAGPGGLWPSWNQVQRWKAVTSIQERLLQQREEEWQVGQELIAGSWTEIVQAQIEAAIHAPMDKRFQAARFLMDVLRTPNAPVSAKIGGNLTELTQRYGGGTIKLTRVTEMAEYNDHMQEQAPPPGDEDIVLDLPVNRP